MKIKNPERQTGWFALVCIVIFVATSGYNEWENLAGAAAVNLAVRAFRTLTLCNV